MKKLKASLALLFFFLSATGCITELNVKKVPTDGDNKGKANGYFYSLPIPYLVVKPNGDGTMEVEVEYLPDPDHQYAVSGWSFLAAHDLTVDVDEQGILKKIVWNSDDSAMAAGLAESAGVVGAAKITANGEAEKTQEAKMEAQAKAVADKLAEAKKAEKVAEIEYRVALAEQEIKGGADKDAQIKVATAEVRRDAASRTVKEVASGQTFNEPASSSAQLERDLKAIAEDIQQAEAQLQQAEAPLQQAEAPLLDQAKAQLQQAKAQLQQAKDKLKPAKDNLQLEVTKEIKKFDPVWGWVWYEIVDPPENNNNKNITLREVEQGQYLGLSAGPPKSVSKPADFTLTITKPSPGVIQLETGELAKITIESTLDLAAAPDKDKEEATLKNKSNGKNVTEDFLLGITQDGKRKLIVDLSPETPTGNYALELKTNIGSLEKDILQNKEVEIKLIRK